MLAKVGGSDYFEYADTTIRILGNVALVKNVTDMRNAASKDTPNRLNVLYVWVKGQDGWQVMPVIRSNFPSRCTGAGREIARVTLGHAR